MPNERDLKSLSLPLKLLAVAILTLLYGIFLLDSHWGLGFTILNTSFIGLLLLIRPDIKNKESFFYLGLSFILSIFITLRSNELGRLLTFFSVYLLNCLAVSRSNSPKNQTLSLKSLILIPLQVFFLAFSQLVFWLDLTRSYITGKRKVSEFSQANLALGVIIAIPVLIIFTFLLSSADPIFEKYLNNFFSQIHIDFELVKKTLEAILFFGIFSALLSNNFKIHQEFLLLLNNHKIQKELTVASTLIILLLGAFLLVQGQFLFAQEKLLKEMGIMFSEYTRKGYTELLIVSSISLAIISVLTNKAGNKTSNFIKSITLIFIAEIFLLLLSATYRVYLYQDAHGFTQIRLMGILFSVWLTVTLFIFLYRFLETKEIPLFTYLFSNAALVLLLMQLINIDYTIAVIKKPNLGYGIDYPYIMRLSNDSQPGWEEALTYLEKSRECSWDELTAINWMESRIYLTQELKRQNWHNFGAWTYPDAQALTYLEKNEKRIRDLAQHYQGCYNIKQANEQLKIEQMNATPVPSPVTQTPPPSPAIERSGQF